MYPVQTKRVSEFDLRNSNQTDMNPKRDGTIRISAVSLLAGHDVLVIDDMVKTGGTLVECAKALKAGGWLPARINARGWRWSLTVGHTVYLLV